MINKLRAGSRGQDGLAEDTTAATAVRDLVGSALSHSDLLGPAMILLAGRNCSPRCPVSARSHRMRHKELSLLD
jgi:hypothetical protein